MHRMNVLITGASGFLGGHLVELFQEAGHSVRGLVRPTSRCERLEAVGVEIVRGDLKDRESLRRAVEGTDVVVHAASTMGGVPAEYVESTVKGTADLLAEAEAAGVRRFVHISSISVYPMAKLPKGQALTEDSPYEADPLFLSNYTKSKIGSDRAALECAERGRMQVFVLRPGILYGPGGKWNISRMGYPLGKKGFVIVGSGRTVLPACYVRNCARAALVAAEATSVTGGVFNVLDDESFTQLDYLRRIKADVRPRMRIVRLPYWFARCFGWGVGVGMRLLGRSNPFHPAHMIGCRRQLRYSNERAKQVLGWAPDIPREAALAATMSDLARREALSRRAVLRGLGQPAEGEPPVTACVVGCGVIAQTHLGILKRMKNARVLALCDMNLDAAREMASRFGVPNAYDDLEAMLEAERPRVLHVLTPPQSYLAITEVAARHGCSLYVEKPMSVDAADARRMADCVREHGVFLCVGHNHIYDPIVVRARRIIESGALGDILWVDSYYGMNLGGNPASRYLVPGGGKQWTFNLPGGLYQNVAPHPLCLALELLGAPTQVDAHARSAHVVPHQTTDELRIMLQTEKSGGLVTVSLAASPRFQYLNVHGAHGTLMVDLLNKRLALHGDMRGVPKPIARAMRNLQHGWTIIWSTMTGMVKVLAQRWTPYDGMALLIREYYRALQTGDEPPVGPDEGVAVMETMDQVWRIVDHQNATAQTGQETL